MAVRETLELDLRGALQQIQNLEQEINDLRRPVDIPVDITGNAPSEIRAIDDRLDDIQNGARNVNRELGEMEQSASSAVGDFSRLSNEMGIAEDSATGIAREIEQARDAAARLDTATDGAKRSLDLAEDEAGRLTRELLQADRAAAGINTRAGSLVGSFSTLGGLAAGIGGALAAIGGTAILGGAVRGANAAVQTFAQLEDSINAVQVVFGDASSSVLKFGEDAAQSAGLSQVAFNQAVAPIGGLLQNFGFNAEEAARASVVLVQRGADLASVYGGSVQDALLAVGAALRGEADPLERYSASISAARVESFALATGLAATKAEITPAITLQARYGLILSDTAKVAGDYVANVEDLANAQKTAAGEATNVAGVFGEALAPAFEAVLIQAVPVLNFFESLTPALGESAEGASGAAAGISEFTSAVVLGFGGLGDIFGAAGDVLSGFPALFDDIAAAVVEGDFSFSALGEQMDDFNERTANQFIRVASQSIPAAIKKGFAPIDAFGQAIAFLAQQDDGLLTIQASFERLAIQSGITDGELARVTRSLLEQADVLGFSADEIAFLEGQLRILNEALDDGGRANADYIASVGGFPGVFDTTTSTFTTFVGALGELPSKMNSVTVETRLAADLLGQALNPFDEAEDNVTISVQTFFNRVTEEINREARFQADIVELILREQFDLAEMLLEQGSTAQPLATGFLSDRGLAEATNAALSSGTTATSEAIGDFLEEAIANAPPGPARQVLIDLMTEGLINSPEVEEGIKEGTARQANIYVSTFRDDLEEEINNMEVQGLQEKLQDLFAGVTFDVSADQFNFPDSGAFQGTIGVGAVFGGGGVSIVNNFTGPVQDAPTQVAQATQSIGAAAATFNRIGGA